MQLVDSGFGLGFGRATAETVRAKRSAEERVLVGVEKFISSLSSFLTVS